MADKVTIRVLDDRSALDLLKFDMTPLPAERDSILIMFYRFYRQTCFVAYEMDKLVGVLLAVPDSVEIGHVYLHYLVVHPEMRGLGIGGALMARFMEEMKVRHVQRITLMTSNPKNEGFYKRFGFKADETVDVKNDMVLAYIQEVKKMLFFVVDLNDTWKHT